MEANHQPGLPIAMPRAAVPAGSGADLVPSSLQNVSTSGGKFLVRASVSPFQSTLRDVSSGGTFVVYHGVQGELISSDLNY